MRTSFKIYSILLIIFITTLFGFSVRAEDKNEEPYSSTIQLNYGYKFSDGSLDVWATAPAVIVNEKTAVSFDISQNDFSELLIAKKAGYETIGIPFENIPQGAVYELYNGNNYVDVTEVIKSETILGNIVILKTEDTLGTPVKFSPKSELNDEEFFATGYSNSIMDNLHYAKPENILKQKIKLTEEEDQYIRFSIESQETFKGSAIINNHNELYGLIIGTENGGTALSVKSLSQLLDTYNIIYETADVIRPIDKTALHSATNAASKIDTETVAYTDESLDSFKNYYQSANNVLYDENVTQAQVDHATKNLENAIINLEEKPPEKHYGLIIGLVIGFILLAAGTVITILCLRDRELIYKLLGVKKKAPAPVPYKMSEIIDDDTPIDGLEKEPEIPEPQPKQEKTKETSKEEKLKTSSKTASKEEKKFSDNFSGGYIYNDRSDVPSNKKQSKVLPDTSVLTSDMASNDEIVGAPYIIRVKNRERFIINHNQFTIGRDYDVDYRIPENPAIGKSHCRFINVSGQWYIIDNKSKNKTLINGIEAKPNESIPIYDKTEIILANEKFIFRIINDNEQDIPGTDFLRTEEDKKISQTQEEVISSPEDPGTNVLTAGELPEGLKVPHLIIKGKKIKINKYPFSVGRSKKASYKYTNDISVSREHFIITKDDGVFYIKDNDSSNGTFLNGEPLDTLEEYVLKDSDEIRVLNDVFEFHV